MEVLLLDTTEKEGEDNTLYHYVHTSVRVGCFSTPSRSSTTDTTHWLDLRGVLAAAVGATASLCGEPLKFARFGSGESNRSAGVVGFVNIYEVLYVLVFTSSDLPETIVHYYTRSSCDLLLSFLGYPDAKLGQWRGRDGCGTLAAQLDTVCRGICSIMEKDLSFGSHLQFAFDGRVPAVNYPLETMAKLAVLDAPFGDTTTSTQKYSPIGRCVFYRDQLAFSTMRSDFLRMFFQWLRDDEYFAPDSSVTKPPNCSEKDGSPTRIDTFELHDFRFTRHGGYPKRHALLIITQENLQLAFLVERKLELEGSDDGIGWAKHLSDDVNERCVEEIATFCSQELEAYTKTTRALRQGRVEAVQTQFTDQLQRNHESTQNPFLWYSVALDRLRGVIIGDELHDQQIKSQQNTHDYILTRFVQHIVAQQQSTRCMYSPAAETSPELPSGIPPRNLNVDDPSTLFLRENPTDEGDISTSDAHIFPQSQYTHEPYENKGRGLRQTAERVFVDGHPFWIIASHFETLEYFSVLDAALPPDLLEHEMNRLCAFGGADPANASDPDE